MKKNVETLEAGDWVVLDSLIISRFCGSVWKVTGVANSRVYLEAYATDPKTNKVEVKDRKYVARKSIRLAFTTEAEAAAASAKARELSEIHEAAVRRLEREHQQRVKDYIDTL